MHVCTYVYTNPSSTNKYVQTIEERCREGKKERDTSRCPHQLIPDGRKKEREKVVTLCDFIRCTGSHFLKMENKNHKNIEIINFIHTNALSLFSPFLSSLPSPHSLLSPLTHPTFKANDESEGNGRSERSRISPTHLNPGGGRGRQKLTGPSERERRGKESETKIKG